jgi:hypothetical protein
MNNLVLITSVIKTPNLPLSYIETRSVYSHEERFEQTKKTIQSVREKIPNAKIFIVECSELDNEESNYLKDNVDYLLNLIDQPEKVQYIYSISKSLGEGTMTIEAFNYIQQNNIEYDNLIKISGRYWLSENFNYDIFENNDIVVKYIDDNIENVFTALYKLPKDKVVTYKNYLENNLNQMFICIGYEIIFSNFLKSEDIQKIININPIGLEGYVSVAKEFYSG